MSDLLPGKSDIVIHPYTCKVEADNNYRVECWRVGDNSPLWSKSGFQELDEAMLDGLMWLRANVLEISTAIQSEIDKRTP